MHRIIPDEIAQKESLTHVLFYPDDINKTTLWVKAKALHPPNSSPHEVSFNRACYMPDEAQKYLAKKIRRHSKPRCFLRMTVEGLKHALSKAKDAISKSDEDAPEEDVFFKYTPIYSVDTHGVWPDHISKVWGTGYNPAHVDLYYSKPFRKNEANEFPLLLTKIITSDRLGYCEVLCEKEEDFDEIKWCGKKLCDSKGIF